MFSYSYVNTLRLLELEAAIPLLPAGARVLEVGAGAGQQAAELKRRGFDVEAIDLASSIYREHQLFPVTEYDGRHIPFPDGSFDIVFSSNVLEHVPDLAAMHAEIRRILKPEGECIHIVPRHSWRFWTSASALPEALASLAGSRSRAELRIAAGKIARSALQQRHGERGNFVSEYWYFHPRWWRRNFRENGFELVREQPVGVFYTGNLLFGERLPLRGRKALARYLGSSCQLFQLRPRRAAPPPA